MLAYIYLIEIKEMPLTNMASPLCQYIYPIGFGLAGKELYIYIGGSSGGPTVLQSSSFREREREERKGNVKLWCFVKCFYQEEKKPGGGQIMSFTSYIYIHTQHYSQLIIYISSFLCSISSRDFYFIFTCLYRALLIL